MALWMEDSSSLGSATWLDVYYRKAATPFRTSDPTPGVFPVGAHCVLDHTVA